MGGFAILLIVIAYLGVATWLALRAGTWRRRALVIAVAALLPTLDAAIGRMVVRHLCARDGGLQVYRVVENVEGVMGLAPDKATLERTGFRFVEIDRPSSDPGRVVRRIERLPDGELAETFDSKPRARLGYRLNTVSRRMLTMLYGYQDSQVVDLSSGEVVGRYRQFMGATGWAERLLGAFTDAGGPSLEFCPDYEQRPDPERLILTVLRPSSPR
jgi:hypothetical protein